MAEVNALEKDQDVSSLYDLQTFLVSFLHGDLRITFGHIHDHDFELYKVCVMLIYE